MAILDMSKVRRDIETTVEEFCRANGWRYVSTNNGKLAMVSDESMWKIVSCNGALELYRIDIYADANVNQWLIGTYMDITSLLDSFRTSQNGA